MDELTPEQIAAIRKLREQLIAESRAEHGCLFSMDEIKAIAAEVEDRKTAKSAANTSRQPNDSEPGWVPLLRHWWKHIAIGFTASLAVVLTFLVVQGHFGAGDAYVGQTDPSEVRGTVNDLPLSLSVDFKTSKIVLRDSGMKLDGTLTPLATESSSGTNVYRLDMGGKDSDGKIVTMTNGRAHFILKTPGRVITGKKDTTEVRLEGRLDVAGLRNYKVIRSYLP